MWQAISDVPALASGPWQAIGQVTSVLTLAAFSISALAAVARVSLKSKEKQLLAAPEEQRPALIQAIHDSFLVPAGPVDTARLTPDQAFSLLLQQVRDRARRFYVVALLIAFIALLAAATTAFAYSRAQGAIAPLPDTLSDSPAQRASLVASLSDAYAYSGHLATFLDGWMRPGTIETARSANGSLSFTGGQGQVSKSIDTSLMPIVVPPQDYVRRAQLTSAQASNVAAFLSAYRQLRGALQLVSAAPSDGLRVALIDATSAAREATSRGARAICSITDSLPTLTRAFPPREDALSPCPRSRTPGSNNED